GGQCGPSAPGSRLDADHPSAGVLIPRRFTLQERILPPPSLGGLVNEWPAERRDDWSALPPVAADPKPETRGSSGEDPDNAGIRREPCLPEHEAIAPDAPQPADPFAILMDETEDEPAQAKRLRQRMRAVARQAALDPGDGLEL
ncbi:MAG: hypothetical protein L0Y50_00820, partial [Beijerinckiaceae bacterium]|nr:hypothetical protein [Beijerinckiaceae bacterium]